MPATSKIPVLTFAVLPTPVNCEPSPLNVVAVTTPVWNAFPSGLKVIPDPTRVFDLNVAIPATSKIPVLTFAVLPVPVNAEPSPTKLAAVTTPAVTLNPDASSVAAVPTLNVVAVTTPTGTLIPDSLTVTADPTLSIVPLILPMTSPVTPPTRFPLNVVAVTTPAVTLSPDSLIVTAVPTLKVVEVVTPTTLIPDSLIVTADPTVV